MCVYVQSNTGYIQGSTSDPVHIEEFLKHAALFDNVLLTTEERKDVNYIKIQKQLNKKLLQIIDEVRVFIETIPGCAYTIELDHGVNGLLRKISIHFDAEYNSRTHSVLQSFVGKYGYVTKKTGLAATKKSNSSVGSNTNKERVYHRCIGLKEYYWKDLII